MDDYVSMKLCKDYGMSMIFQYFPCISEIHRYSQQPQRKAWTWNGRRRAWARQPQGARQQRRKLGRPASNAEHVSIESKYHG